jgi:enoyl-[acyl-carrier protein] reductase I
VGLLDHKIAVLFGVANHRSIAWHIAQAFAAEGATLVFAALPRVVPDVEKLAASIGLVPEVYPCDVANDDDVPRVCQHVLDKHGGADIAVHSLAFANREDISERGFIETPRAGFTLALDISCYSLTLIARHTQALFKARGGGSLITLTYMGSERVIPNYNVMGVAKAALECSVRYLAYDLGPHNIRVNAISSGPQRTLSARAITGFASMETEVQSRAPLHRLADPKDVAGAALYLCSHLSQSVTGEVLHVDAGYNIMAM